MRYLILVIVAFQMTGCLKTRGEIGGSETAKVSQEQQQVAVRRADDSSRLNDLEAVVRRMNGRFETIEHKLNTKLGGVEQKNRSEEATLASLTEQMRIFDNRIQVLETRIAGLEAKKAAAPIQGRTKTAAIKKGTGYFEDAESLFQKKNWKKAIVAYNKYRENYPKGKFWGDATYKIGVCFQELRLINEAKSFYEEVVEKMPKSTSARKARYRLNQLKKRG